MRRALTIAALSCLCVGSGAGLYRAAVEAPPTVAPLPLPEEKPGTRTVRFEAPPARAFAEIAARPLFSSDRRPPAPPAPTAEASRRPPPRIVVSGTTSLGKALLRVDGGPAELHGLGAMLAGWRLSQIDVARDRVVLERGGEELVFELGEVAPDGEGVSRPARAVEIPAEPLRRTGSPEAQNRGRPPRSGRPQARMTDMIDRLEEID
ncbi:MAG: hypothetical protein ACFBSD_11080 [Paracoccaceae bacterium]